MMRIERHYDDEVLISLLGDPSAEAAARDQHLGLCAPCSDLLDSYRAISECLGVAAVWDLREMKAEEPVPSTIATLRAFADQMDREDLAAERILTHLLAGPRESWMPRLATHPEWRTAGVVRKLIAATDHALDTMPPDAVEITALATEIADNLDPKQYASDTVLKLRGAAWRERAYATFYIGEFTTALAGVDRAEKAFLATVTSQYDTARVDLVRARIFIAMDRAADALPLIDRATATFRLFNEPIRVNKARETEAIARYRSDDRRGALAIWQEVESSLPPDELHDRAILLQNMAHCYRELGDFAAAQVHFELAVELFDTLGVETNAVRARWHAAEMLMRTNRHAEALRLLTELRGKFERLGMKSEMAVISLDIAEVLTVLGRTSEVVALCQSLIAYYSKEEMASTSRAVLALSYLREAIAAGEAAPQVVRHVREYVRKLPAQPHLLFAPLPA